MAAVQKTDVLASVIREAEKRLAMAGIDNPTLDVRVLTAHALGLDRAQLLSNLDRVLSQREKRHLEILIECRARREPVARITGMREFWSLPFGLNEATLVPRPESETLIETTLNYLKFLPLNSEKAPLRILDLGTGSGCLLLSLLHELQNATGIGIDREPRAVNQAQKNAERLHLTERAEFRTNNWADGIDERFDIVISNPPYIASKDIPTLMPEVSDYDPNLALDGGEDGLEAYRLLIPQLPQLLKPNGFAVFEIGKGQVELVKELFKKAGFKKIETQQDLSSIERCVIASLENFSAL